MYHKEESDCAWIYVYNDAGDLLYEAGFGAQQLGRTGPHGSNWQ